jgi:type IV secretory pathway TraG/TraD family ATPase VirD4
MRSGEGEHHRGIIYDAKRNMVPMLAGIGVPEDDILILNPADARAVAWNIAGDIQNRDDAANIVHILLPDQIKGSSENQFFNRALRGLSTQVVMNLHLLSPGNWRLIDWLNAMRTVDNLRRILNTTEEGKATVAGFINQADEMVGGIIATIHTNLIEPYETIARVWARCERSVSLTDWIKHRQIIVLGYDHNQDAVDRINQAILHRVTQLICALPDRPMWGDDQTIVMLDELRFGPEHLKLPHLITFGRSKAAHVMLGVADLDGLNDVYGEAKTNEMIGLCGNIAVLRLLNPKTRDWAAKLFGDYEAWETESSESVTKGTTSGHNNSSSSRSQNDGKTTRRVKRESILPSEFFSLKPTNRDNGMQGFFCTPAMGAWRARISPVFIDAHLPPVAPKVPDFVARPNPAVEPVRWSPQDEKQFLTQSGNVPGEPLPPPAAPSQRKYRLPSW